MQADQNAQPKRRIFFRRILRGILYAIVYFAIITVWKGIDPAYARHCYTLGWVTQCGLIFFSEALCVCAALFGKRWLACTVFLGAWLGVALGQLLGANPAGAPYGFGHNGWLIWLCVQLVAIAVGGILEYIASRRK